MKTTVFWLTMLACSTFIVAAATEVFANDKCCTPGQPIAFPYAWCDTSCQEEGLTCATETRCQMYTDGSCQSATALNCEAISELAYPPVKYQCQVIPCDDGYPPHATWIRCDEKTIGFCEEATREDCDGALCN